MSKHKSLYLTFAMLKDRFAIILVKILIFSSGVGASKLPRSCSSRGRGLSSMSSYLRNSGLYSLGGGVSL